MFIMSIFMSITNNNSLPGSTSTTSLPSHLSSEHFLDDKSEEIEYSGEQQQLPIDVNANASMMEDLNQLYAQLQEPPQHQAIKNTYTSKRKELLGRIQELLLEDSDVPINPNDLIPPEVKVLGNDALENIIKNIEAYQRSKTDGWFGNFIADALSKAFSFATGGVYTIETIEQDPELQHDLEKFFNRYFYILPLPFTIIGRIFSHVKLSDPSRTHNILSSNQPNENEQVPIAQTNMLKRKIPSFVSTNK